MNLFMAVKAMSMEFHLLVVWAQVDIQSAESLVIWQN